MCVIIILTIMHSFRWMTLPVCATSRETDMLSKWFICCLNDHMLTSVPPVSSFISSHPLLPLPLFSHVSHHPAPSPFPGPNLFSSKSVLSLLAFKLFFFFYHALSFYLRPIFLSPIKSKCATSILTLPAVPPQRGLQRCPTPDVFLNI